MSAADLPPGPPPLQEPPTLSTAAGVAAFAAFTSGVMAVAAYGQIALWVSFYTPWLNNVPMLGVALGIALIGLSLALQAPSARARIPTLLALGLLSAGGAGFALFLLFNGLFTALSVCVVPWSAASVVPLLLGWRSISAVAADRAAARAEIARMMAESPSNDDLHIAPEGNRWFLPVTASLLAVPALALAVAVLAPATFNAGVAHARAIGAGQWPWADPWASRTEGYPYSGSPVEWYVDYEASFVPVDRDHILATVDDIAADVSHRLVAETGLADLDAAERALWAADKQRLLPEWVAAELRRRNVYYQPESLFSASFDPRANALPDTIHLDCDELVYVFLHVAWRLDLRMTAIPSPLHAYLRWDGPDGEGPIYVETTAFRDGREDALGDPYFIDADYHRSGRGGTWASRDVILAAGLYEPATERDIRDAIVGNVLEGVARADRYHPEEAEAHLDGTRDITLVANLYSWYVRQAVSELRAGDAEGARRDALRARALRARFGPLVIDGRAAEEEVLTKLGAPAPP